MRHRRLGRTGLFVSELCLGTMTFGSAADGNNSVYQGMGAQDAGEATRLVARALEAGINFFDTADIYRDGEAEEILGQALKAVGVPRDDVMIGTKCFGLMGSAQAAGRPRLNDSGLSRRHIIKSVEASLRRLGTDHIDLYQAHGFDPLTPLDETLRAYDQLIAAGKVRYIGCSNWPAWAVAEANGVAERLGLERFASVQAYYSLVGRDVERELVPMMRRQGLGMIVWSPLAGGYLSGKYSAGGNEGAGDGAGRRGHFDSPPVNLSRGDAIVACLLPMAAQRGISVARIALVWLLHQEVVASVILGARRLTQLEDNIGAIEVVLTAEERTMLDRVSALSPEYRQISYQRQRHLSWRHGRGPDSDLSVQSEGRTDKSVQSEAERAGSGPVPIDFAAGWPHSRARAVPRKTANEAMTMKIGVVAFLLVCAVAGPLRAQADVRRRAPPIADERVEIIPTARGGSIGLLVDPAPMAKRMVVLFPGGDGAMRIDAAGPHRLGGNFLIRTRGLWRGSGIVAVAVDAPSDHQNGLGDFRTTADYAADLADVLARLKAEFGLPVWLVGTSRGTISVANLASRLSAQQIAGVVMTSGVTRAGGARSSAVATIASNDLSRISVPVLLAAHNGDACEQSPPDGLRRLGEGALAPHVIGFLAFDGGASPESPPCEALSPHGFFGIEEKVIAALADGILAH